MLRVLACLPSLVPALALLACACGPVRAGHQPWDPPDYWTAERFVEIEGMRICYLDAGPPDASQTLVFVHGWSGNLQNWWDQFELFRRNYRVVVFDFPGHGKSERGEHVDYSMELYVDVVEGVFRELDIDHAHVIGNSAGAWVAAVFAMEHPERVDKLVLSDSTGTRHRGPVGPILPVMSGRMLQMANMTTGEHYPGLDAKSRARQEFVASFAGSVEEKPYLDMLGALLRPTYARIDHRLADIAAPTLVVWGHDDPVVPRRAMRVFERELADARSYVVRLGGHTPMMQSPDEFNCVVEAFLDERELVGCKQYALTKQQKRERLAGRDAGLKYE
ncbi:alpha/beta fold hydrolase [Nannocystaceae bacterium ST9]